MMSRSECQYMPFCEERIVSQLIRSRYKLEPLKTSEDVLCLYIDLDRQIGKADLDAEQREILRLLMEGFTLTDIGEILGKEYASLRLRYRSAVMKIIDMNNREWGEVYARR